MGGPGETNGVPAYRRGSVEEGNGGGGGVCSFTDPASWADVPPALFGPLAQIRGSVQLPLWIVPLQQGTYRVSLMLGGHPKHMVCRQLPAAAWRN